MIDQGFVDYKLCICFNVTNRLDFAAKVAPEFLNQ